MVIDISLIDILSKVFENIPSSKESNYLLSIKDSEFSKDVLYVTIGENQSMIKFLPTQKNIKYTLSNANYIFGDDNRLCREIGITEILCRRSDIDNFGDDVYYEIIRTTTSDKYNEYYFYVLKNSLEQLFVTYERRDSHHSILSPIMNGAKLMEMKVGRFIKKAIPSISDVILEKIVTSYSLELGLSINGHNLIELVSGDDIRKFYDSSTYKYIKGQLGNSCMRSSSCQRYFDIYVSNPDKCSMLILKSTDGMLIGRALLWTLDDGSKYIDRIYAYNEVIRLNFIRYAEINKYKYFSGQSGDLSHRTPIIIDNGVQIKNDLKITLKNSKFDLYPYMDTFRFFQDGVFISTIDNVETEYHYLEFSSTSGCSQLRGNRERLVEPIEEPVENPSNISLEEAMCVSSIPRVECTIGSILFEPEQCRSVELDGNDDGCEFDDSDDYDDYHGFYEDYHDNDYNY